MIHCFLPHVLVSLGASLVLHHIEETKHHDWLHIVLLTPIILLLSFSLPKAYNEHRDVRPGVLAIVGVFILTFALLLGGVSETPLTILGSVFVITAHLMNRRSIKASSRLVTA